MKTFGDSTKTPGQYSDDRCYILAQFPEDTNLDWARELRAALGGGELKYQKYLSLRHKVQAKKKLWDRVKSGTAEATVVVIEGKFYIDAIVYRLREEGADLGHDVTLNEILFQAALCMIDHAPVMRLPQLFGNGVPTIGWEPKVFTPEAVFRRIGGKIGDATVFAARAHASFDIDEIAAAASTNELILSPFRSRLLLEFNRTDRVFDEEHPKSAAMLNEMFNSYDPRRSRVRLARVQEASSETNDWLQAADFCAGFASEIMMNAPNDHERDLRRQFRKVIFNGATR